MKIRLGKIAQADPKWNQEATRLVAESRLVAAAAAREYDLNMSARIPQAILVLVSAGLAASFTALLLLILGSMRGSEEKRRRLWVYAPALALSLPAAVIMLRWWLGGTGGWHGEAADWLMGWGLATALAAAWIPARGRRAEGLVWSEEAESWKRAPRCAARHFWAAHGAAAVGSAESGASVDLPALGRHGMLAAGAAAAMVTGVGLVLSNLGRFSAAHESLSDAFGSLYWVLFAVLLAAGVRRLSFLAPAGAQGVPPLRPRLAAAAATWGCALLGFLGAGFACDAAGARSLRAALDSVRGTGLLIDFPVQRPLPSEARNSAALYRKAGEAYEAAKKDPLFYLNKSEDDLARLYLERAALGAATADETAATRRLLAKHSVLLAMLAEGAARPEEHWGVDWDTRPEYKIKVPRYAALVGLSRLLACRAVLAAADGRTADAVKDLRLGLTLARSVGSEPLLISVMVESAIANTMLNVASPVLARAPADLAKREILPLLNGFRLAAGFRQARSIEHYGMNRWIGSFGWLDAARSGGAVDDIPWIYWPYLKHDLAAYYRASRELDLALTLPYSETKAAYDKAYERFQRQGWLYGRMAMPHLDNLYANILAAQARQSLVHAGYAALAFKEKEKRWPDGLWEVGSYKSLTSVLRDPFTGGPFRILRRHGGVVIYSVGPDGIDDQGAPYDVQNRTGDLSWRL